MNEPVTFRPARPGDEGLILRFIRLLAEYEHMQDQVVASEALLTEWLFEKARPKSFLPLPAARKSVSPCFSIAFPPSLAVPGSIWRTFSC